MELEVKRAYCDEVFKQIRDKRSYDPRLYNDVLDEPGKKILIDITDYNDEAKEKIYDIMNNDKYRK